ncbi:MAG TPA: hypothetical protein VIZ65_07240 [Cellvibrionaceae bacterium]
MKCLILNTGVVGLLTAVSIRRQYGPNVSVRIVDTYSPEEQSIIRLGPETLNFIVRELGFSLTDLMRGPNPGIFYLGLQVKPGGMAETSIITHAPTRAQIGAMPVNYAVERLRRVGGMEKLEQYSLAARMIKANVMVLPNKKGECPLGEDEIGITISADHLRNLLMSQLLKDGVSLAPMKVAELHSENECIRVVFSDGSAETFDFIISTDANFEIFTRVQCSRSIQWASTDSLSNPCTTIVFDANGWQFTESVSGKKRKEIRCIGEADEEFKAAHCDNDEIKTKTSAWFGATWKNRIVFLSEYNFWGAEFLLDPLQPIVKVVALLTNLVPMHADADLLARYFNERTEEVGIACRQYVVACLMESPVKHREQVISEYDMATYSARKSVYLSTGQPMQAPANLIGEGSWAAFWHAFSVYPYNISSLLQSLDLEEVVRQLSDIDLNIAEIVPRLPSHKYYISLINGGEA